MTDRKSQTHGLGTVFTLLLYLHKLYARALLIAAKWRLVRTRQLQA